MNLTNLQETLKSQARQIAHLYEGLALVQRRQNRVRDDLGVTQECLDEVWEKVRLLHNKEIGGFLLEPEIITLAHINNAIQNILWSKK